MAAQTQPTDELGNQYQGGPGSAYRPPVTDGPPAPAGTSPTQGQGVLPGGQQWGPPAPGGSGSTFGSAYTSLPELQGLGGPISASTFQAPEIRQRTVAPAQVNFGEFGPYTRQMTDEELTSRQLEGLLASDSPYMRQAALAGQRMAAQRGALSSSISAGASQASAIQAALPIAAADAQAYQRMISENAAAINSANLAKLESTTRLALGNLQSATALAQTGMQTEAQSKIAALNANAQTYVTQLRIQAEKENLMFQAAHDRSMEFLQQEGRMDLQELRNQGVLANTELQGNIEYRLLTTELEAEVASSIFGAGSDLLASIYLSGADPEQMPGMSTNALAALISFQNLVYGDGGG